MSPQLHPLLQCYLTTAQDMLQAAALLVTGMALGIREPAPALEDTGSWQHIFSGSQVEPKQIVLDSKDAAGPVMICLQYSVPFHPLSEMLLTQAIDVTVLFCDIFKHFQHFCPLLAQWCVFLTSI